MASTIYYLLCSNDGKIHDARLTNSFATGITALICKVAFSLDTADLADVHTHALGETGGTLDDSSAAPATLALAGADSDGDVTYDSVYAGDVYVQVAHAVGATGAGNEDRALAVSCSGKDVTITFGTDGVGDSVVPTATEVADLVNMDIEARRRVLATAGGTGASTVGTQALTSLAGGTAISYTPPPVDPYLKAEDWSGDGAADPDDGVWEMAPDGVKSCTLTVKKWDRRGDAAIAEAGDKFSLSIPGSGDCCPGGRIELDANGEATIVFTPMAAHKGESDIILRGINVSYIANQGRIRFV